MTKIGERLWMGMVVLLWGCGGGGSHNVAPIALPQSVTTYEEQVVDMVLQGYDENDDNLTFRIVAPPLHGQLLGEAPLVRYLPKKDYFGEDSFIFGVNDGELDSKEVEVRIHVLPINDLPVAEPLHLALLEDNNKTFTLAAYDVDSDQLWYTIVRPPLHGDLYGEPPELTYQPDVAYVGEDSFSYRVYDENSSTEPIEVNLTVIHVKPDVVSISGEITYDWVPPKPDHQGLDYGLITQKPVRGVLVELLNEENIPQQSTITDANGLYSFRGVLPDTLLKVRVYAQLPEQNRTTAWWVKVVDNTNGDALYGFEGELRSSGQHDSLRHLNATAGWSGSDYTTPRVAAPFAILDVIYASMQNLLDVDANASFTPLMVNWSPNNITAVGSRQMGQIETTHYQDKNLYVLGDANGDTDEYDTHVIAHEWGHYYEDTFSRSDSIGGMHTAGDYLDIRVAFGEGFGNAISAISLRDPLYFDTYGVAQSEGWSMDIEWDAVTPKGWFSEGSIQHILYDLFDNDGEEGDDNLSLGFAPLHHVLIGKQKQTQAFTSLFSFITALKAENNQSAEAIDAVVAMEGIAPIEDIYGRGRTLLPTEEPYTPLDMDATAEICTTNTYGDKGSRNKLSNHKYLSFTLPVDGNYGIQVVRNNRGEDNLSSDPDFSIFSTFPTFAEVGIAESPLIDREEVQTHLKEGAYLLDIVDWNTQEGACFDVAVYEN